MKFPETQLRAIYVAQMAEISERLKASENFVVAYQDSRSMIEFESAVLQLRKALEAVAYAAIAPNK